MAGTRRLNQLLETVGERVDLPDGALVIALSGGADSAALARLCVDAGRESRCVHVNHGFPGSPLMQTAAESIAHALSLDLEVRDVVVRDGPSPEGQARRARYEALAGVDGQVLTAHTFDDNVETVLFNVIRGTGLKGLTGIPYRRSHNVSRPMLKVTRADSRELATLAGLPFVDDPMNNDLALGRNLLRARVIPMLTELNPRLPESIARLAAAATSDSEHLEREAAKIPVLSKEGSYAVVVGDLVASPKPMRDRALKRLLAQAIDSGGVTAERLEALWSVAEGETGRRQIEGGFVAFRSGPLLVIELPTVSFDQPIALTPGHHRHGLVEFEVVASDGVCKVAPLSRWGALFPASAHLEVGPDGWVTADGEPAWKPGERRLPVAWYEPGSVGYLSVFANEVTGWTSGH